MSVQFHKSVGFISKSIPIELEESVGLVSVSPSKRLDCVLRTKGDKRYVEISGAQSVTIDVTKVHGDFYNDGYFGTVQWNSSETEIVYVAAPNASEDDEKFNYYQDAGEGYTGKLKPSLVCVSLTEKTANIIDLPFWGISQPIFHSQKGFLFVGIAQEPMRLGIKFCTNRRTGLYHYVDGTVKRLSDEKLNARYPILNPSKTKLYYLSHLLFGPHDSCAQLMEYDLESNTERILVPMVVHAIDDDVFPGIFSPGLQHDSVIDTPPTGDVIILASTWRSRSVILAIDSKGKVTNLTSGTESWTLLKVEMGHVFAIKSSLKEFGSLYYCTLEKPEWREILSPSIPDDVKDWISGINYQISKVPERTTDLEVILVQNIHKKNVLSAKGSPLIVFPHGGPHGAITTAFSIATAAFAVLGFTVLLVNYTGSTGFGNHSVHSLIGKIGDSDIADTHAAAIWASKQPGIDHTNVFLYGGSHGGFITAHLLAREPDFYRAGALRNPVINIGAMISNTDISDWCYSEAGFDFDSATPPILDGKTYQDMLKVSPIYFIKDKVSPALLLLGEKDRRVPPSQGYRWAEYLRSRNHSIQVMTFPNDGHALDSFDAERVGFEASAGFMLQHIQ